MWYDIVHFAVSKARPAPALVSRVYFSVPRSPGRGFLTHFLSGTTHRAEGTSRSRQRSKASPSQCVGKQIPPSCSSFSRHVLSYLRIVHLHPTLKILPPGDGHCVWAGHEVCRARPDATSLAQDGRAADDGRRERSLCGPPRAQQRRARRRSDLSFQVWFALNHQSATSVGVSTWRPETGMSSPPRP